MKIQLQCRRGRGDVATVAGLILAATLGVLVFPAGRVMAAPAPAPTRPNVLFIVADDLRDTLGCYGNTAVRTPNIDRLASRGVRFTRAYVQYPVCNPSRTSFLTGLRCEQTGVVDNRLFFRALLPDVVTLPQLLRQNGWWAGAYGKIFHVGEAYGEFRPGWTDLGRSWDEARLFKPAPDSLRVAGRNLTGGVLAWCHWAAMSGTDDDQPDGQSARAAIAAIETNTAAGRPWFVGAGFHRPHDPFVSPQKYFDLYPEGSLKLHRDPADLDPLPPMSMPGGPFALAFAAFSDEKRLEFLRAYYAGVSFMDAQVGRLMDTLDRLQQWDNTIVVFMGDHGYHLGERGWWNKNTLFERSCRTPLIIAAPGARAGAECRSLVEFIDLYPTLAGLCGLRPPAPLPGTNFAPLLKDPTLPGKAAAFTLVMRGAAGYGQAVRTDRWRYTRWSDGGEELYDLAADPGETHDLHAAEAHRDVVKALRGQLAAVGPYRAKTTNPPPVKDLILPGESFRVGGRAAFVLWPAPEKRRQPQPWICYAPTLPGLPDAHEKWMHEQFLAAGIAVAGVDVGEAYGSPRGNDGLEALYEELTVRRGCALKPCLLGRSRGGLWLTSWAAEHTNRVAGFAGIYPVFDLRSYPSVAKAAPAYGLTPAQLTSRLDEFNPIARVDRLARARIPVFLIHGDKDTVVPLPENSGAFAARYRDAGAGDLLRLIVPPGQGHNFWPGFFKSQELVDFAIARARAGAEVSPGNPGK